MSSYSRRHAASELPVVRASDGTLLTARVEYVNRGAKTEVRYSGGERHVLLDLTHGDFEIALMVDDRRYSAVGEWGTNTLTEVLQALIKEGYQLRCCFTCQHYGSSGLSNEWSFGTEGYCNLRGEPTTDDLTHILHVCQYWAQERPSLLVDQAEHTRLVSLYDQAWSWAKGDSQVIDDVFRARILSPYATEPDDFIREYTWVVFNSGMRMRVIRQKWPSLEKIFRHWDYDSICQNKSVIRKEASEVFRHLGKIDAVIRTADFICKTGWAIVRGAIVAGISKSTGGNIYPSQQFFDYVRKLPRPNWMGATNSRYLAKNLGFDLAKDDRHMKRLAGQNGYSTDAEGVQCFIEKVSQCVRERVSVVETVLWNACEAGRI